MLQIFDSLIKPIATCNSEIWLGYKSCFQKKSVDEMFDMPLKSFNEFDKVLDRFLKYSVCTRSALQSVKFWCPE